MAYHGQTIRAHPPNSQYAFCQWSDGETENPRTVTWDENVCAIFKGTHISDDASAFSNNGQRKLVETPDGHMWQTYTSSIGGYSHVFLEYSTDHGTTWQIMPNKYGSAYMDWSGQGKCPSLDWCSAGGDYTVTVVFQEPSGGSYAIAYRTFMINSYGVYQEFYNYTVYTEPPGGDSYSVNANPVIAFGESVYMGNGGSTFIVAFERKSSLTYYGGTYNSGINLTWGWLDYAGRLNVTKNSVGPQQISTTNASSFHPTIYANKAALSPFFHLAYEQDANQFSSSVQYTYQRLLCSLQSGLLQPNHFVPIVKLFVYAQFLSEHSRHDAEQSRLFVRWLDLSGNTKYSS